MHLKINLNQQWINFRPEFVLVSAGFDAHQGRSLLGQLNYTDEGYGVVADYLTVDICSKICMMEETLYMLGGWIQC